MVGNRLIDSESNVAEFAYIQDLTARPDKTTERILRYLTANSAHEYNYRNELHDFIYRRDRAMPQRVRELLDNEVTQTSRPSWKTISREMFRHSTTPDIHRSNVIREINCFCQATREPEIVIVEPEDDTEIPPDATITSGGNPVPMIDQGSNGSIQGMIRNHEMREWLRRSLGNSSDDDTESSEEVPPLVPRHGERGANDDESEPGVFP